MGEKPPSVQAYCISYSASPPGEGAPFDDALAGGVSVNVFGLSKTLGVESDAPVDPDRRADANPNSPPTNVALPVSCVCEFRVSDMSQAAGHASARFVFNETAESIEEAEEESERDGSAGVPHGP